MYIFQKNFRTAAAVAFLAAVLSGSALAQTAPPADAAAKPAAPAAPEKTLKPGEYEMYNAALVDLGKNDPTKAIADLDAWKQKFPNSDYANDGKVQYIRAYAAGKQPDKAIAVAGELLQNDIDSLFPDPASGPQVVLQVLVTLVQTVTQVPNPTPDQAAIVKKGADLLISYNRKAKGYSDEQWKQLHTQVDPIARQALYYIAVAPAVDALQKKDYANAEALFRKALQDYPENATVANNLATALVGEYVTKTAPEKFPEALYYYARAASVDPTAGGVTKEWQTQANGPDQLLLKYYKQYHGSDDGLADLKATAAKSPVPPAGFTIKNTAELEKEKHDALVASSPDLARWLDVKKLLDTGGEAYFKDNMSDAGMPAFKGKVLEGKPACNSKELVVALSDDTTPEVTLKLDTPLRGKPVPGVVSFDGAIAKAFTATPFNLTMEMETAKIQGLEKTACGPAAPAPKKK